MFELLTAYPLTPAYSQVASAFADENWGAKQIIRTPNVPAAVDSIQSDTDAVLSVSEMANALHAIGKPTTAQDVELGFDPDDYPLA